MGLRREWKNLYKLAGKTDKLWHGRWSTVTAEQPKLVNIKSVWPELVMICSWTWTASMVADCLLLWFHWDMYTATAEHTGRGAKSQVCLETLCCIWAKHFKVIATWFPLLLYRSSVMTVFFTIHGPLLFVIFLYLPRTLSTLNERLRRFKVFNSNSADYMKQFSQLQAKYRQVGYGVYKSHVPNSLFYKVLALLKVPAPKESTDLSFWTQNLYQLCVWQFCRNVHGYNMCA